MLYKPPIPPAIQFPEPETVIRYAKLGFKMLRILRNAAKLKGREHAEKFAEM